MQVNPEVTDDKPIASEGELALIERQIERLEESLELVADEAAGELAALHAGVTEAEAKYRIKMLPIQTPLWKLRAQVHDYYLRDAYPVEAEEVKGSWSADVFSMRDLIAAAAQNPEEYAQYLKPNDVALNKRARSDKAAFHVPGVAAIKKEKESK